MGKSLVIRRSGRRFGVGLVPREAERVDPALNFNDWVELMSSFVYNGVRYSLPHAMQEEIGADFAGLSRSAFKGNAIVFACMAVRAGLFSEARFQFRQLRAGRPGDLFGNADLAPLETPGPGETTGDLLSRAILHADLGGNWFGTNRYGGVTTLMPNWMTIVAGNPQKDASIWDPATKVVGYSYLPGGPGSGEDPIVFLPEEIAHFAPIPDPEARFRGMSWLTPVIRDVMADKAFTDHKLAFTEHGATPNLAVKFNIDDINKFMPWVEKFREQHEGSQNAYKTLFLNAGMDVTPIGTDFNQLDFKAVQGGGETRIAAAAGVPAAVVGISESLAGSALNAGNYQSSRRRFADLTMRPLWRNMAGSLARIIIVPPNAELWFDDRDISALAEDQKDAAEIMQRKAAAMSALIINGYAPDSVTEAVNSGDFSKLVHTQLVSVQLQEPGTQIPVGGNGKPSGNGSGALPTLPQPQKGRFEEIEDAIRAMVPRNQDPPPAPSIDIHVDLPEIHNHITIPDINVEIPAQEPARFDEGAIQVTVEAAEQPAPVVNVTVEPPEPAPARSRTVDFGDGRVATITEDDD